jgi:hypothetical protein
MLTNSQLQPIRPAGVADHVANIMFGFCRPADPLSGSELFYVNQQRPANLVCYVCATVREPWSSRILVKYKDKKTECLCLQVPFLFCICNEFFYTILTLKNWYNYVSCERLCGGAPITVYQSKKELNVMLNQTSHWTHPSLLPWRHYGQSSRS